MVHRLPKISMERTLGHSHELGMGERWPNDCVQLYSWCRKVYEKRAEKV